ncbi:MAG TPA: nuclear transport factor 2 family protein [Actinomycetota bacterium]|nr:nuclear transport factor 2 family protein [Actinomycetota bacterium]
MVDRLDHASARALSQRACEVLSAHDPELLGSLFAEDVVFEDDAWPEVIRGLDQLERFLGVVWRAFPDARWEIVDGPFVAEDGRGLAVHGRISGRMLGPLDPPGFAPTGQPISFEYAGFFEIGGGLVRRGRVILNLQAAAIQVGAAPRQGSAAERMVVWLQRRRARRARLLDRRT